MNRWITFCSSAAAPESHRHGFRFGLNMLLVMTAFLALSNSLYAQGKGGKKGGGGGGDSLPDPTVVVTLDVAASEISLGWISGGGSTAGFIVAYEKDGMPRKKCRSGTQIDVGDVEVFTITGLNYDSLYGIRVCAYDDAGERSNGITIQVVTRQLMDRQALDNWTDQFFPATNSDGANGAGVAIQPDGKILVAGYVRQEINEAITMCVVRYNPDLSIDTSFGNGGLAICFYDNRVWSVGTEILLLDDGSMLVAGRAEGIRGVVRFSSSGEVLAQFFDDYLSSPPIRGMIAQGDKVILMRQADRDGPDEEGFTDFTTDFGLYRLNLEDLKFDTSFGESGEAWYDIDGLKNQGASITEMADGSIFAQGSVTLDNELPKFLHYVIFNSDGDVTFEQTLPIYADPNNATVLTDSNGDIYMTGTSPLDASNTSFGGFIVKVNPTDGSVDATFGEDGVITTTYPLSKAAFDSQDRLVALAGRTRHWEGQARDVVRFKRDFSLDENFGDNGFVALKPPGEAASDAPVWGISDLALDAEDRPVLVGKAGAYYVLTGPAWIIRLNK